MTVATPETSGIDHIRAALDLIADKAEAEAKTQRNIADKWRKRRLLAAIPSAGTALAVGGMAIVAELPAGWEWLRVAVVVLVFVVFGIGAYVTGLNIPERFRDHSTLQAQYEQLVLHAHILDDVDVPELMSLPQARCRLQAIVAWYDSIKGVPVPETMLFGDTSSSTELEKEANGGQGGIRRT